MDCISARHAAERWNISMRRVQVLCEQGRIPGATKIGNTWMIPADAQKPVDPRREKKPPPENSLSSELAHVIEATTKYIPRDNPDIILDAAIVGEEWLRTYCEGALAYFRGDHAREYNAFVNAATRLRRSSAAARWR